jgi:ribose transport system substrate-binding protein
MWHRRSLLKASAGVVGLAALPGSLASRAFAQDKPVLCNSFRTLTQQYNIMFDRGGRLFAERMGYEYVALVNEGNSEKSLSDVRALLARTGGNVIMNIEPNDTPDARPIVEACAKAGAYVVTQWNKPDDLNPSDFNPYYVAHISFDGFPAGKATATRLIQEMGGTGGVLGLGGIISNPPAIQRKAGLEAAIAEAGGQVELLDFQVANWNQTDAFDITQAWITRFGNEVKGIWAANDDMALGAIEALRAEGLVGQIPVTGMDAPEAAIAALQSGDLLATAAWDPIWTGGVGLALGLKARAGEFDVASLPPEKRAFFGPWRFLDRENSESYVADYIDNPPVYDFDDPWALSSGGM